MELWSKFRQSSIDNYGKVYEVPVIQDQYQLYSISTSHAVSVIEYQYQS